MCEPMKPAPPVTSALLISMGTPAPQDRRGRAQRDGQVPAKAPMVYVVEIHADPLRVINFLPPRHLPQARQPRPHGEQPAGVGTVLSDLDRSDHPGPDQAHL